MKVLLKYLILVISLNSVKSENLAQKDSGNFFLSNAVSEAIKDYVLRRGSYFLIKKSVSDCNIDLLDDIISQVVKELSELQLRTVIEDENHHRGIKSRQRFLTIIFTDSLMSFNNFFTKFVKVNVKYRRPYTVVFLNKIDKAEMEIVFSSFWKIFTKNVNLMMKNENGTVDLFAFAPFNRNKCGDTRPVKINEFNNNRLKWKTNDFQTKKTRNLHKCPLSIGCSLGSADPFLMTRDHSNGTVEIYGVEKDIFEEFARRLNFTPIFEVRETFPGLLYENGTATGL